jgi:hypothetical protein
MTPNVWYREHTAENICTNQQKTNPPQLKKTNTIQGLTCNAMPSTAAGSVPVITIKHYAITK